MQIVRAGEETSILLSFQRKDGSKISDLRSNGMEGKQEFTEPSLHIMWQLLRYERQEEESGPITAPHGATVQDNQSQYTAYSKISPSEMDINTPFCISTTAEVSATYLLVNLELQSKSLQILLYLQPYCPTIKNITSAEDSIFSQSQDVLFGCCLIELVQ